MSPCSRLCAGNLLRQPSSRDAFGFVLVGTFVMLVLGLIDAWGIGF
jgi:hypothetical protein